MKDMYRYLEKYVGTYRVLADLDPDTHDFPRNSKGKIPDSFEDFYIPCSKGEIRHTYDDGILVWRVLNKPKTGNNVYDALKAKYGDKINIELDDCGIDIMIYFEEKDIKKIATVVKPKTNGSKIPPLSSKNLPKANYKIPEEDAEKLANIIKELTQKQKMQGIRQWNKEFDTIIEKKKGKRFNIEDERDNSGLKAKEFIHSIGLWDDYCKYVKKQIKTIGEN